MDISLCKLYLVPSTTRVDHQLRLLQLLSETKDREQRVVDYASTLPTTFI